MGVALAEAAAARGADVTLLAANVALPTDATIRRVDLESAEELQRASRTRFARADLFISAAAVADFRPDGGRRQDEEAAGEEQRTLTLVRTPDVIAGLSAVRRPGQVLVGFAAEHGAGALDYGRDKLRRKGLDAIVVNDVSQAGIGFDATENEVVIVLPDREVPVARGASAPSPTRSSTRSPRCSADGAARQASTRARCVPRRLARCRTPDVAGELVALENRTTARRGSSGSRPATGRGPGSPGASRPPVAGGRSHRR